MSKDKAKRNRITFTTAQGIQQEIYLSADYDAAVVLEFKGLVKRLSHIRRFGGELTRQETNKIENLIPALRKKLIDSGLIEGDNSEKIPVLEVFLQQYFSSRPDRSQPHHKRLYNYLTEYFGKKKRIDLITPAEAGGIRNYLINERTARHGKLKPSSANRAIRAIKPIFRFAVDCGYIAVSPFAKVKCGSTESKERREYITADRIEQAIATCGDNVEFRGLLAIARYEGLRIPSEIRDLKFSDFRNEKTGIIFTVPDTGKTGQRRVPVFVEFLPYLTELQQQRKDGQEYLFEKYRRVKTNGKVKFVNIGALIRKKMKRDGVPLWEKLFTNLRSSCITDKDKVINNTFRMNAIFGNSDEIRQKHYRQPDTDEEYAALGNVSGLQDTSVKNMSEKWSENMSEFGQITSIWAFFQSIIKRRANFSDIVDIILVERGLDKEQYNEFVRVNPIVGKISSFVNALLFESYDDTEKKVSLFSFSWNCIKNAVKGLSLFRQFYNNLTIPQSFLTVSESGNFSNGEDRI